MRLRFLTIVFVLLLAWPAWAANYFWVGGTGTFDNTATTHISTSSGGSAGAGPVTSADNIVFDASSGGGTVTVTNGTAFTIWDATGYTGSFTGGNARPLGNVTFGTANASAAVGIQLDTATANVTLTTNGKSIGGLTCSTSAGASPTLSLGDDLTIAFNGFSLNNCIFNSNNHNITSTTFGRGGGSDPTTVNMGSGTWTTTASAGTQWNFGNSGLTLNSNTSTIKFTTTTGAISFVGGGKTYNNVWFAHGAGTSAITITGTNTFNDFKDDGTAAHTISFPAGSTTTVSSFSVTGHSGQLISLISDTGGSAFTLSKTTGSVATDFLSIKDSHALGGATWCAGANSTNVSGNTGWVFAACGGTTNTSRMFLMFN